MNRLAAVTLTGQKHKNREIPCEDYSYAQSANGVDAVVVCDGAGSKQYTHARYGSEAACKAVHSLITEHFDALYEENREAAVKSIIIATIQIAFAQLMVEHKLDSIERLSCTLLFCAVKDRRVLIGHLGDGLIARISPNAISPLTMPQNDKAGHTYFVTANHAADYMRLIKTTVDDIHAIVLMTDGVQDSVYDEESGLVKPVVARMAETLAKGTEIAQKELESIISQYIVGGSNNSDDSSFGVIFFENTAAPGTSNLPSSASKFQRSEETFQQLQMSMVEEVKKSRTIMQECRENYNSSEPDDSKPASTSDAVAKESRVAEEPIEENVTKEADKVKEKGKDKRLLFASAAAVIELIIIIILIFMLNM